jgi:anti-repressor protein
MNAIIPFCYEDQAFRVIEHEGEPWFVAADVSRVLKIKNSRDAVARLDEDEKGVVTTDTLGGNQEVVIVNESGLYSLILTSRKPEAKRFKKWVTSEVLPSIRRTGSYGQAQKPERDEDIQPRSTATRRIWSKADTETPASSARHSRGRS